MWLLKRRNKRKEESEGKHKNDEKQPFQESDKLEEVMAHEQLNKPVKGSTPPDRRNKEVSKITNLTEQLMDKSNRIKYRPHLYIYRYQSLESVESEIFIFTISNSKEVGIITKPKNNWLERIEEGIERKDVIEIENVGKDLCKWKPITGNIQTMLKELQNDNETNIWIFYEGQGIEYPWEWIYWENDSRNNFFWGDKFHIVRIPKNCEFEDSKFQIKKVANIVGKCRCGGDDDSSFRKLLGKNYTVIKEDENGDYHVGGTVEDLNDIDCLHIVANIDTQEKYIKLYDLCKNILRNLDNKQLKFLFFNIRIPHDKKDNYSLSRLKELFMEAKIWIWIDTTLDLPDGPVPPFVEYFYKEFQSNNKNIEEAVTKAREEIEKQKDLGLKRFHRLAFVVKGDPCVTITWIAG